MIRRLKRLIEVRIPSGSAGIPRAGTLENSRVFAAGYIPWMNGRRARSGRYR